MKIATVHGLMYWLERLLDHQRALYIDPLVGRVQHHRELFGRDQ
jgi:hypothetical protein